MTPEGQSGNRARLWVVAVVLLGTFARSAWTLFHETVRHDGLGFTYTLGDWLTNYGGGVVRRGLSGALLTSLPLSAEGLQWAVFLGICLVTGAFLAAVFLLFRQTSRSNGWIMLALSPAFATFLLWSFPGGPRKELLGAALLGVIALVVRRWRHDGVAGSLSQWSVLLAAALFVPAALTHEVTLAYVPAAALLVWESRVVMARPLSAVALVLLGASAVAAVGVMALAARGIDIAAICSVLTDRGLDQSVCGGAIRDLGGTASEALANQISFFPPYFFYLSLAALALLPVYLVGAQRRDWWLLVATVAALLPEIVFGGDYGRWIFVAAAALSLTLLSRPREQLGPEHAVPWVWAVAYLLLWRVPAVGYGFAESFLTQGYRWLFVLVRGG